MEEQFKYLADVVEEKNFKVEDGIPIISMDSIQSLSPLTYISDNRKTNTKAYDTSTYSDEPDIRHYQCLRTK